LFTEHQLKSLARDYVRLPKRSSREVFGVRLPHETLCSFATKSPREDMIFEVRVQWVAENSTEASRLARSHPAWGDSAGEGRRLHPDMYQYRPNPESNEVAVVAMVLALGRRTVVVSGKNPTLILKAARLLRAGRPQRI
jgi:hypothetical protein